MSRIPPRLARRLDRLSVAAHGFHRWAHHPLCAEYEGELLRFGRARVCRGCAMAAAGGLLGLAAGMALPALPLRWLAPLSAVGLPFVVMAGAGSHASAAPAEGSPEAEALSRSHRIPPRRAKLATRLLPCALAASGAIQCLRQGSPWGLAIAAFAGLQALAAVLLYRRQGPQRRPCATCPERFAMHRCRGVQPILRRERAFQRLSGRLIAEATRARP
ncbi:MAG TPA: hypothetical protein VJ483_02975 [Holophagaceae bacterium]|nr:hypothetical protein [Holophagaceae bacterium]